LLLSSPAGTVAAIALSRGFEQLGRFSLDYRKRFEESPREALQRTRAKSS